MKNLALCLFVMLTLMGCDPKTLQKTIDSIGKIPLTETQIADGLKQALNLGVDSSVKNLSRLDGFYKSSYKILLPQESRVVIDRLKSIPGFSTLEEEAIKRINKAAEDAASKAGPIFLQAVKDMTIADATNILMGPKNAATTYLNEKTYTKLYETFYPVLVESMNKFGALDYWADAINTYNKIPFITKVNPDLANHVNTKALDALFDQIAQKELGIRSDINQRTTDLLRQVFARQD